MSRPEGGAPPDLPEGTPWIETGRGGLFFVNLLLATPALIVLLPWAAGALLRALGVLRGPSPLLDPIPAVAAAALPYLGWLAVVPLWTVWRNLRIEPRRGVRSALLVFGALHLGVLAMTVAAWA